MGKFIVIMIIVLMILSGSCGDCGACDGCDSCDGGGCSSCSSCESCDDGYSRDERYYFDENYGEITLKIHRADGTLLELKGDRNTSNPNSLFYVSAGEYRIRGLSYSEDVGYEYELYIKMDNTTYKFYDENNGVNTVYNKRLMYYHKNGSVVEVTEERRIIRYNVAYVIELGNKREQLDYIYSVGDTVMTQEIQDKLGQVFGGTRYEFNGFVVDGTTRTFNTDGVVDKEFIKQFNGSRGIMVRSVSQGQKVKVKLHYNLQNVSDEEKLVPFNVNLNTLWEMNLSNVEFFGWSISPVEELYWTGEIPEKYATETLDLYAVHKTYKEINIQGTTARVYNDNTLSISIPNGAMGLKESMDAKQYFKLSKLYDYVQEGKTYYWHIAG